MASAIVSALTDIAVRRDVAMADSGEVDPATTPVESAIFVEEFERLLEALGEEERQIVVLRLRDHTYDDVAEAVGCSERTVRRILDRLRRRLEQTLPAQES